VEPLRFCLRLVTDVMLVVGFMVLPGAKGAWRTERCARACRRQMRMLGFRPRLQGREHLQRGSGLMVMNHLSWLDPILVSGLLGADFVTSKEVEGDPLLGPICTKAGCFFSDRRSSRSIGDEHKAMAEALRRRRICVFPEATSTNGERLRDFKPAFFESARLAACPVQPLVIRYRTIDGRRLDRRSRDRVHWYGDMAFAPHLLGLLCLRCVVVDLVVLPTIDWAGHDRKSMARLCHDQIERVYHSLA
jgi:1-acyl-sn-glycerol-3-phosphate acyltransferase